MVATFVNTGEFWNIEVEDWPKLSGIQFLLQISVLALWDSSNFFDFW